MRLFLLSLLFVCSPLTIILLAQGSGDERSTQGAVEYVSSYGFCFSLPDDWRGFSILQKNWEGFRQCSRGSCAIAKGPKLIIRNPKWERPNSTEDIPIMVFTLKQWESLEDGKFSVSAAPVGPSELGRNKEYVFALPARYNYDLLDGWEQVERILMGHALHAPCSK